MAVLVNGTPTDFFSTFRGLRQGASRQREDEEKGCQSPTYCLLMILSFFKSKIIPIGGVEEVDRAAAVFGCKVGNLPTNYLGLPLGASHKSCRVWDGESETQIGKNSKGVLVGRYGGKKEDPLGEMGGGWTTREVRESYGTGLWKDIRKGWEEFFLRTRIHIGNGGQTRFWWDMWVGDSKLKDLFPLLFGIAANNSAIVADLWGRQEGGGGGWEVHFRRPFQDWELEEVNRFLGYISAVRVQEGEDFLVWKIERKGTFKVNSYYRSLKEDNSPVFPEKEVWGSYAL
ncbi:hypothetical protein CK203_014543 [Vitis vinifera]|uniref:Uncharacterized protein n=1 Tax=Vitis vinifera TaxID=29760 RepID=A0A438K4K0_VITVI|nr:hypothetical protein CK203_014543 [Vitis vinifera]